MAYKGKSAKKRKRYKHIKKITIFNKCTKDSRRILVVLLSIIVISISIAPTYAYFTSSVDFIEGGSGLSSLDIQNGNVNLSVDYGDAKWLNSSSNIVSNVTNPASGDEVTYGPLWLNNGQSNISTKIDLLTEYQLTNQIDNDWNKNNTTCEPFEVIVGDIDNFGCTPLSDVYKDGVSTTTHTLNIFPKEYDAQGTDRRMVGSKFYETLKTISGNTPFKNYTYWRNNTTSYLSESYFSTKNIGTYYMDGYAERALNMQGQTTSTSYGDKEWNMDNANWYCIQTAKPITFKYNKIQSNEEIDSVTFQIFTDDIQSSSATKGTKGTFITNGGASAYKVYLIGTDSDGYEFKDEIEDFSKAINDYAQSGPIGNMRTLKLPSKYFNRIKEASGLDKGLKLLIDDQDYTKGDGYAIDFAKMTVNAETSSTTKITVSGYIKDDSGNAISGAVVSTEDGVTATTDANGLYSLETTVGLLKLKVVKEGYIDTVKDFGILYENATNQNINMSEIGEKYTVQIIAQKCDSSGNPIGGLSDIVVSSQNLKKLDDTQFKLIENGTVVQQAIDLNLEPNTKYKLSYKVILKNKDAIDKNNDFKLGLKVNNLKVKATQENNNGWSMEGTGEQYSTVQAINKVETSEGGSSGGSSATDTKIYFESPDTKESDGTTYWWNQIAPTIKLDDADTEVAQVGTSNWYVGTTNTVPINSKIKVFEGGTGEPNEGLTIHIYQNDGTENGILHYWNKENSSVETTVWDDKKAVIEEDPGYGTNWHKFVISPEDPFLRGDSTQYFNTNIARKDDPALSRYKIKRIWDKNNLEYDIPINAKEVYYKLESCTFSEINKDKWKYYNGAIENRELSGILYYFNTRRVFICTN